MTCQIVSTVIVTSKMHISVVSIVLLVVILEATTTTNACVFPAFLQSKGDRDIKWMYYIKQQGTRADANFYWVTFSDGEMDVKAYKRNNPPDSIQPYSLRCLKITSFVESDVLDSSNTQRFITSHQYSDVDETRFTCVMFTRISPYVVLMHAGPLTAVEQVDQCDGNLTAGQWPMVIDEIDEPRQQYVPASMIGSFKLAIRDVYTNETSCSQNDLEPSKLEIGCSQKNEMIFSLDNDCKLGDLTMKPKNIVYSIGNWRITNYTFIVLRNTGTRLVWCLRIPNETMLNNFTAQLFLDVVFDPRPPLMLEKATHLELRLARMPSTTNLCQDLSNQCIDDSNVCHSSSKSSCMDTCESCPPFINETCGFSESIQGKWIWVSESTRSGEIQISPNKIYFSTFSSEPLLCMPTVHQVSSRYPLKFITENGCFPHFTCIDFTIISPGFVSYKLGSVDYWPDAYFELTDPYDKFCSDVHFPSDGQYTNSITHTMVRDPHGVDIDNVTSACLIGGLKSIVLSFEETSGPGKDRCKGYFSVPRDNPHTIQIDNSSCSDWPIEMTTHHCMSSILLNRGRRLVVTVAEWSNSNETVEFNFRCWMFTEHLNFLFVLPWTDCNEDIFDSIESDDKYRNERDTFAIRVQDEESTTESDLITTTEANLWTTTKSNIDVITVLSDLNSTTQSAVDVGGGTRLRIDIVWCTIITTVGLYTMHN